MSKSFGPYRVFWSGIESMHSGVHAPRPRTQPVLQLLVLAVPLNCAPCSISRRRYDRTHVPNLRVREGNTARLMQTTCRESLYLR